MSGDEGSAVYDEEGNFIGMVIATSGSRQVVAKAENIEKALAIGFTKEYRDKHWRKCRFGCDPRGCGSEGRLTDCFATRKRDSDGELHNYCMRDQLPCNAKWEE